jgi:tetratricopeptide (TPR) repeat protein
MKPAQRIVVVCFLIFCCICCLASIVTAIDCGCNDAPPSPPDYSNDPSWGSSLEDLTGGSGSTADTGGSGSPSGGADVNSGGDSGSGGSSGYDISSGSSSDSSSSSGQTGGSSEEGVVWRMKADDLAQKGMYNESLAAYEKSISYDPYILKTWLGKGKVLLVLGRPLDAADAFGRAIRLDPSSTDAMVLLGDAQNASGSYDDAIGSYTKALAMNPNLVGIGDKIAGTEIAKTTVFEVNNSDEAVIEVVTPAEKTIAPESTSADHISSPSPVAQATHSAPFPGMGAVLMLFGGGSIFMLLRKRRQ